MNNKKKSQKDKFDQWEYFDDCPICQAMKSADQEGRELSLLELKKVFREAKELNKNK